MGVFNTKIKGLKKNLLMITVFLITVFVSVWGTSLYYKNKIGKFSILRPELNPEANKLGYTFTWDSILCQPNKNNGNCSKQLEEKFTIVQSHGNALCAAKIQEIAKQGKAILNNVSQPRKTVNTPIFKTPETTTCKDDVLSGGIKCVTY